MTTNPRQNLFSRRYKPTAIFLQLLASIPFLAGTSYAQSALTGEEFDQFTRGKTFTYFESELGYGAEQYKSNKRVTWSYGDDDCVDGDWYEPDPGLICFVYERLDASPQCWQFYRSGDGLRATLATPDGQTELYSARPNTEPLQCIGPKIGV